MGAGSSQAELNEEDIIARHDLALRRFRSKTAAQKLFQDAELLFKRTHFDRHAGTSSKLQAYKEAEDMYRQSAAKFRFSQEHAMAIRASARGRDAQHKRQQKQDDLCKLHKATHDGNGDMVRWCIEQLRINVDSFDVFNQTALHWAASFHKTTMIATMLVENYGCDVNPVDLNGMMPLHCAALAGNLSFVQYLISKNANVSAVDNFGFTPLHHASFTDAADVVLYLISQGVDVDAQTTDGNSVVWIAANNGCIKSLNALADAGAKLNVPNRLGICPVDAAKDAALTWLEDRGFQPDQGMVQLLQQQEVLEREVIQAQENQSEGVCSRVLSFLKRVFLNGSDETGERDITESEMVIRSMQSHRTRRGTTSALNVRNEEPQTRLSPQRGEANSRMRGNRSFASNRMSPPSEIEMSAVGENDEVAAGVAGQRAARHFAPPLPQQFASSRVSKQESQHLHQSEFERPQVDVTGTSQLSQLSPPTHLHSKLAERRQRAAAHIKQDDVPGVANARANALASTAPLRPHEAQLPGAHVPELHLSPKSNPSHARTLSPASSSASATTSPSALLASPSTAGGGGGGVRSGGGWANIQKRRIGGTAKLPGGNTSNSNTSNSNTSNSNMYANV